MGNQKIIIRLVENPEELQQMFYVRWLVLRQPLGRAKGTEQDEYENESFQMIAIHNNSVIGCARLRPMSAKLGTINYVAVLPEFQNQRVGKQMMKKLIDKAKSENLQEIKLKSRYYCVNFYKNLGFIESGEPFSFLEILHVPMSIKL